MKSLVLFDIDGTLLHTNGAGKQSFVRTLNAVFGWEDDMAAIQFAGNTDLNVLNEIARAHGHQLRDEEIIAFRERLPVELKAARKDFHITLYPGVRELLETLAADSGVLLGLVTGNFRSSAMVKLGFFGLEGFFRDGGFGEDAVARADIARKAVERLEKHLSLPPADKYLSPPPPKCLSPSEKRGNRVLIGDTPSDIAAAHALGAISIAVATGHFSRLILEQAGADLVLDDFSEPAPLFDRL